MNELPSELAAIILSGDKLAMYELLTDAAHLDRGTLLALEPYMLQSPMLSYAYAAYVLCRRWPEAEPGLLRSPKYGAMYARYVIRDRWPEWEDTMEAMLKRHEINLNDQEWIGWYWMHMGG
jgi:hypothetical protein